MFPSRSVFLALVTLLVPSVAWAQTGLWTIDPGHSAATFQVRHMVVANVKGEFAGPVGTAMFDPKDLSTLRIDATIDARTINTRNPDRDRRARISGGADASARRLPRRSIVATLVSSTTAYSKEEARL